MRMDGVGSKWMVVQGKHHLWRIPSESSKSTLNITHSQLPNPKYAKCVLKYTEEVPYGFAHFYLEIHGWGEDNVGKAGGIKRGKVTFQEKLRSFCRLELETLSHYLRLPLFKTFMEIISLASPKKS